MGYVAGADDDELRFWTAAELIKQHRQVELAQSIGAPVLDKPRWRMCLERILEVEYFDPTQGHEWLTLHDASSKSK